MSIIEKQINDFPYGIIDTIENKDIPDGASSKSLNWMTMGDRIELRRGQTPVGTESTSTGKITGIHTAYRADGTAVIFRKNGQKLEYFISGTSTDWTECGTNLFGSAGASDDASFANYTTNAGNQTFVSTPNSGMWKIMVANPGSAVNLASGNSLQGKFRMKITQNRMIAWGRPTDTTAIYGSYVDAQAYTTVSGEAYGTGNGATKTFAHNLAAVSGSATGFAVSVTDGTETFTDDYNGNLKGSLGGTGTVNYATGAVSVTFNTAPINLAAITCSYQWEGSTSTGIADFTKSSPRTAGQGFIFRQDEEGLEVMNVFSFGGHEFCFHKRRTWDLNITNTDTNATNLPYRARVGLPSWRAGVATSTGVYYINAIDSSNIKLERLALNEYSTDIIPSVLSKKVTEAGTTLGVILDSFVFDQAAMAEYGDLIVCSCKSSSNATANDRVITYNKLTGAIDYHDFTVNCFTTVGSELWAGDSVSPNVYKIFNGFDDNNASIPNSWEGKLTSLAKDNTEELLYLKKCRKLVVQGLISPSQSVDIYALVDNGDYVYIGTISGSGSYVDRSGSVTIGYNSVGSNTIGGPSDTVTAYNYEKAFKLPFGKFVLIKPKFVATGTGYVSISRKRWWDIQVKVNKILKQYT